MPQRRFHLCRVQFCFASLLKPTVASAVTGLRDPVMSPHRQTSLEQTNVIPVILPCMSEAPYDETIKMIQVSPLLEAGHRRTMATRRLLEKKITPTFVTLFHCVNWLVQPRPKVRVRLGLGLGVGK